MIKATHRIKPVDKLLIPGEEKRRGNETVPRRERERVKVKLM